MDLRDTTALVTGAASGLGRTTASALIQRGAAVVGIDLSGKEPPPDDPGLRMVAGDITSAEDVQRAVDLASELGPLRTVVNCAGIAPSARVLSRAGHHDLATFTRVVQVNLVGTFTVMTLAAEAMSRTDLDPTGQRGVVVNTASIAAYEGQVGQVAYAASKGGVAAMTLPAARDLARHAIRVCTIAPGIVDTPMMQQFPDAVRVAIEAEIPFPSRMATADEFARLVLALVDLEYVNGEVVRMDGALRMPAH